MLQTRDRGTAAGQRRYRPGRAASVLLALVLLAPSCSNGENDGAVPDDGQTEADEPEAATANGLSPEPLPTVGPFSAVATGRWHTCAIRSDGAIECWGSDYDVQSVEGLWRFNSIPDGQHIAVSAGVSHACALSFASYMSCWPATLHGLHSGVLGWPGEEPFDAVAVGGDHACGLHVDGAIECWGDEYAGRTNPPDGSFTALSAGVQHSCALRTDGTAACWGSNADRRTEAPSSISLSADATPAGYASTRPSSAGARTSRGCSTHRAGSSRPWLREATTPAHCAPTAASNAGEPCDHHRAALQHHAEMCKRPPPSGVTTSR